MIRFDGKVAVITGAGRGLGRAYALELGRRGARVVVNDPGVAQDGRGEDSTPAEAVVAEITAAGGEAIANLGNITDRDQAAALIGSAGDRWGRIDILINNAGIIRDRSFAKKTLDDFDAVLAVHLAGTVNCTHAAWPLMIDQGYGRILMTSSISGTLGSFGQSDYAMAKTGVLGFMNSLKLEGERKGVRVNAISPGAGTRISSGVLSQGEFAALAPERVVPAALYLVSDDAPSGHIIQAGGGECSRVVFAQNDEVKLADSTSLEAFAEAYDRISDITRLFPVRPINLSAQ